MTVEISIIVPLYNTEKYVKKCLDSLLAQQFTDFEVIIVNDGSTDRSGEIAKEYVKKDRRFKYYKQTNAGPAAARNRGLQEVSGTFISFVDSDDYIHPSMLQIMYETAIKSDADIVVCEYKRVEEKEPIIIQDVERGNITQVTGKEMLHQMYESTSDYTLYVVAWNKLYRKELFNDIVYDENFLYEDETVAHKLYYKSQKVSYLDDVFYYYVQRKGSIVNSPIDIVRLDRVYALKNREQFFKKLKDVELHQKAVLHFVEIFFKDYYAVKRTLEGVDKELKRVKRVFDKSLFTIFLNPYITVRRKVFYCLFSLSPKVFDYVQAIRAKRTDVQIKQENISR